MKLQTSSPDNFQVITSSPHYYQNKAYIKKKKKKKKRNNKYKYNLWAYTKGNVIASAAFTNSPCLLSVFLGHLSYKSLAVATSIPRVSAPALIRERCTWEMFAEQRQNSAAADRLWRWNAAELGRAI